MSEETVEEKEEVKPCPTQAGSFTGYEVEYQNRDKVWRPLPRRTSHPPVGVSYPLMNGGILQTIYLLGYSQAMALAWGARAESEFQMLKLRVIQYKIVYDIKATRDESNITEVGIKPFDD